MSSEMREVEVLLNKWLVRYNELIQMDRTNEAEQVLRCINEGKRALLARTEAGADGVVMEIVEKNGFKHLRLPDDKSLTSLLDFPVGTRFYTHPKDASGNAERYRWLRTALYSQNLDIGEAELSLRCYGAAPALEQFDAAIDAAMQAKEAAE